MSTHLGIDYALQPDKSRMVTPSGEVWMPITEHTRQLSEMTDLVEHWRKIAERDELQIVTLAHALREAIPHMRHSQVCREWHNTESCVCGIYAAQRAAITALDELNIKKEVTQ